MIKNVVKTWWSKTIIIIWSTASDTITPIGVMNRCDDTRGCIVQFWPPDNEHVCSKHVEAWNKLIIKFSASSWLYSKILYSTMPKYSIWYHHTYRCDDTIGCIVQFWPPDDEHMCSKHVEAWYKLIIKFSASSWLILR